MSRASRRAPSRTSSLAAGVGMARSPRIVGVAWDPTSRGVARSCPRRRPAPARGGGGGRVDLRAADRRRRRAGAGHRLLAQRAQPARSSRPWLLARRAERAGWRARSAADRRRSRARRCVPGRPLRDVDPEPLVHVRGVVGGARGHPARVGGADRSPSRRADPAQHLDRASGSRWPAPSCSPASTCPSRAAPSSVTSSRLLGRHAGGGLRHRRRRGAPPRVDGGPMRWPATRRPRSLLLGLCVGHGTGAQRLRPGHVAGHRRARARRAAARPHAREPRAAQPQPDGWSRWRSSSRSSARPSSPGSPSARRHRPPRGRPAC